MYLTNGKFFKYLQFRLAASQRIIFVPPTHIGDEHTIQMIWKHIFCLRQFSASGTHFKNTSGLTCSKNGTKCGSSRTERTSCLGTGR